MHNGEVPAYEEQMGQQMTVNSSDGKHQVVEAYVTNSTCDKVDERSDGSKMKQNLIMALGEMESTIKVPGERAMSMPNIEHKIEKRIKM